jgi:anti-sigma B factor antagonist
MNLKTEKVGDWKVFTLAENRLDACISEDFKEKLLAGVSDGTNRVLIDLQDVRFMDSSGLGAIICCLQKMPRGSKVALARVQEPVSNVLRLTHLDRVFTVVRDPALLTGVQG